MPAIATLALVVCDYDEAIAWYRDRLGFDLISDIDQGSKLWVVMRPRGSGGANLLLARADTPAQQSRIGDQTGGRVFLFLETDDFDRDHAAMLKAGVTFREAPRTEPYGKVAVFEDLYGNGCDLIEPR